MSDGRESRRITSGERVSGRQASSNLQHSPASLYEKRMREQKDRLELLKEKSVRLADYLTAHQPTVISSEEDMSGQFGYKFQPTDNSTKYNIVSQSALPSISYLEKAAFSSADDCIRMYARTFKLEKLNGQMRTELARSLILGKYFGEKAQVFVRFYDIFIINSEKMVYFEERFKMESCLMMKAVYETAPLETIKKWIKELASLVEYMNLHCVAHRFLRLENVLLYAGSSGFSVKLGSFDMATIFWDVKEEQAVLSLKKGLPIDGLPLNLHDHLPPEAFTDNYDASAVDVWSIAVILVTLLTRENPFQVTTSTSSGNEESSTSTSGSNLVGTSLDQWKGYEMKSLLSAEVLSLLNDIFVEADRRLSSYDLERDKRLELNAEEFKREKVPSYFRVDLLKVSFDHQYLNFL